MWAENVNNYNRRKDFLKSKKEQRNISKRDHIQNQMKRIFLHYCRKTDMHGFKFLARDLPPIENYIWISILIILAVFCVILMCISYKSIQSRLPLIQMMDRNFPLNSMSFPAVTICNCNKVYKPAAAPMETILMHAGYKNETIDAFFHNLSLLIQPSFDSPEFELQNRMLYLLDNRLKNFMHHMMQPCDKLLKSCYWLGKSYNCSLIFKVAKSLHGHCCAFNYHAATTYADENHSEECLDFYKRYTSYNKITCNSSECPGRNEILKVPGSGIDAGLMVEIDVDEKNYKSSSRNYAGASIVIHDPHDYPETEISTFTIQPDQEINIVVSVTKIESLDELRMLSPNKRECIFPDEVNYTYSYQSCIAGCKMIRFLKVCDCIPYYYPDTCSNISRTCDLRDVKCISRNLDIITKVFEDIEINGIRHGKCNCDQTCNKTTYKMVADKNRVNHPRYILPWKKNKTTKFSKISVYFQDYGYTLYTKSLYMTWHGIVANLGGLLGICLGGSLISVMEPFIHILLIPLRNYRKRKLEKSEKVNPLEHLPPAKKLFRSVPLDKKSLKEWGEEKNSIFVIDFHNFRERQQRQPISKTKKQFISENIDLFRKHFL